jgi:hypothetical protein
MFTTAHQWILFWNTLIQPTPSHYFVKIQFNIIHAQIFLRNFIPMVSQPKFWINFLSLLCTLRISPISNSLIWYALNFLANAILKSLKVLFKYSVTEMKEFSYNAQCIHILCSPSFSRNSSAKGGVNGWEVSKYHYHLKFSLSISTNISNLILIQL